MERRIGRGLRGKIFLAHLLVIIVGVLTLFAATLSIAPTLFDRLMGAMMGPDASSMGGMMAGMAETTAQAFRSAMLQAGYSPVIPNGYVMVPKEPTPLMPSSM